PDTKDAALAAHPVALVDRRSPDTKDAALKAAAVSHGAGGGFAPVPVTSATPSKDGRSPDTIDAAVVAHAPITIVGAPGFQWGDFGIGVAAALGLVLLIAVSVKAWMARSHQPNPVATA